MMGSHDWMRWATCTGDDFSDHFTDALIANRTAEIALCRTEASAGASPRARALATTMLTGQQAGPARLRSWHHQWDQRDHDHDHDMMHG